MGRIELSRSNELIHKAFEIWRTEEIDVLKALIKAEEELIKEDIGGNE